MDEERRVKVPNILIDIALFIAALVIAVVCIVLIRQPPRAEQARNAVADTKPEDSTALPPAGAAPVASTLVAMPTATMPPVNTVSVPTNVVVASATVPDVPTATPAPSGAGRAAINGDRASATAPIGTRYVDPQGGFSFYRPVAWRMLQPQSPQVAVQLVSDAVPGNLNVVTQRMSGTMSLDQFAAAAVTEIEPVYPMYRLGPRGIEPMTLGGEPARRYEFQGERDGTAIQFTQVIALNNGIAYVVTITATANGGRVFTEQAQVVLETFAFHA